MKHLFLFTIAMLSFTFFFGQENCGSTAYRTHIFGLHSQLEKKEEKINHFVSEISKMGGQTDSYVIPVVVHIIHNEGPENISDDQVYNALSLLNQSFSNSGEFNTDVGVDTQISFCLAQQDPDGNLTNGINRVISPLTSLYNPSDDQELKDLIRWDTNFYLNIWVVSSIIAEPDQSGVVGYATLPTSHGEDYDGIVIEADYFGSNLTDNNVLVHEAGHYCGLYHTFHQGCSNNDCTLDGDFVCDTPPDQTLFSEVCDDGMNSCLTDEDDESNFNPFRSVELGGLGGQIDFQDNYMDYSGLACFENFTLGQSERMNSMLDLLRGDLFDGVQCNVPCEDPLIVEINLSNEYPTVGESVEFDNLTLGYTTIEWFVNGVLISSEDDFVFEFLTEGDFEIEVVFHTEDENCIEYVQFNFLVECDSDGSFVLSSNNVQTEELITANYIGTNTFVEWLVNGDFYSLDEEVTLSFDDPGIHTISVVTSNGVCETTSETQSITVGACLSASFNNIWYLFDHTFDEVTTTSAFDFNGSEMTIITDVPLPNVFENKSSICDENGELRFATDGLTVYGSDYLPIENGEGLFGCYSTHLGTLIIKSPGDNDNYYVITSDCSENNGDTNGLRYSVIDGSANDGMGAVTEEKNILIFSPSGNNMEAIGITRHSNNNDYWLIGSSIANTSAMTFLVSEEGVSSDVVFTPYPEDFGYYSGFFFNPTGEMFFTKSHLCLLNQDTGEIDFFYYFDIPDTIIRAAAFSPDGTKLYTIWADVFGLGVYISKYDIEDLDNIEWIDTIALEESGWGGTDIRAAPDGKIYVVDNLNGDVSVINNPNSDADNIDFDYNSIEFDNYLLEFPNFYTGYTYAKQIQIEGENLACLNTATLYAIDDGLDFNDGVEWSCTGDVILSTIENDVEITFLEPGNYEVIASTTSTCGYSADTVFVQIEPPINLNLEPQIDACIGESIVLDAGDDFSSYSWQDGSEEQLFTVEETGLYHVTVQSESGCSFSDSTQVNVLDAPGIDLGSDFDLCDNIAVILDAGDFYSDYVWQDGQYGSNYTIGNEGVFIVQAYTPCYANDTLTVESCGGTLETAISEWGQSDIHFYPNPATNEVIFENLDLNKIIEIRLIDLTGRKIQVETSSIQVNKLSMDLSSVASGQYLVIFRQLEGAQALKLTVLK